MGKFNITELAEEIDDSVLTKICEEYASEIIKQEKTFLDLVESLEPFLTSSELNRHITGVNVLATVLKQLQRDSFSTSELDFVAQFFCAQIKQHHSFITSGLKGLYYLVQNHQLSQDSLHNVTSTLFGSVVWQTQLLEDRKTFYSILQFIVFHRIEDYKNVSSEFLFNVISSVDGERDPRCLLLLFSFLPKLYSSVSLGPLAEDAFEVVSCYFPIDFHSASADGGSVCRQDLVSALTPCLLATPEFAVFCIPLIQEKLDSTLKSAKVDSYNLLAEGCRVWPVEVLLENCESLWISVKQDTLPPRDAQVADAAVKALQSLVRAVVDSSLSSLLSAILRSCEGFLSDVQMNMFEPSSRLLLSTMEASPLVCEFISNKLLPILVSLLQVTEESAKILVLNKLLTFIQACLTNGVNISSGAVEASWRQLCRELCKCLELSWDEVKQTTYSVLTLAAGHLDFETRHTMYPLLLSHLISNNSSSLRFAGLKFLKTLASLYGDEMETNLIKYIVSNNESEEAVKQHKLEAVCALSLVDRFQPLLAEQVSYLLPSHSQLVVSCLRNFFEMEEVRNNSSLTRFLFSQSSILNHLITLETSREELLNCSRVIQILVSLQNPSDQSTVIRPLVKSVLQLTNFEKTMVLLEALLGPLWPEVTILSNEEVAQTIIPVALQSGDSTLAQQHALQLLSSFINKSDNDELLNLVSLNLEQCSPNQPSLAYSYITKALLLRNHPQTQHWLDIILQQLISPLFGDMAADGFKLILEESETFLSSQNHCRVRLLYRQRLFHLVFPQLIQNPANRTLSQLKVIAYLLAAVPHSVYASHIKQMSPLLVLSLDATCEVLLCTVLKTLTSLLVSDHSSLQDHVDTFIPRFLHLARHNQFMRVRIAALQCLANCLRFPSALLLPHKQQVTVELVSCLDDKKRLVRREAALTRSKWFLLGAPSPDS